MPVPRLGDGTGTLRVPMITNRLGESAVLLKIALVTALLAAGLVGLADSRVLDRTGLVGSCAVVERMSAGTEVWHACRPGRLQGRPNLVRKSCVSQGVVGDVEYWRCRTALGSGPPA